jgi:hypothetical protein
VVQCLEERKAKDEALSSMQDYERAAEAARIGLEAASRRAKPP